MKASELKISSYDDLLVKSVDRLNDIRDYLIELEARIDAQDKLIKEVIETCKSIVNAYSNT